MKTGSVPEAAISEAFRHQTGVADAALVYA
jgi:hypothetical protein